MNKIQLIKIDAEKLDIPQVLLKNVIISSTIVIELLVWIYFLILTNRTSFWQRSTSIGGDIVAMMYILCISACFLSIFILLSKDITKKISIPLVIAALIPTICFSIFNITGKVGAITQLSYVSVGTKRSSFFI